MDSLALKGQFPTIGELSCRALCREMDADEIAAETERQIAQFMEVGARCPISSMGTSTHMRCLASGEVCSPL